MQREIEYRASQDDRRTQESASRVHDFILARTKNHCSRIASRTRVPREGEKPCLRVVLTREETPKRIRENKWPTWAFNTIL